MNTSTRTNNTTLADNQNPIQLFGFGPMFGLSDGSPFVLKVETYLQLAKIPYRFQPGISNLKKAPKGKLPYIIDGDKTVADSSVILDYLATNYRDLDADLSAKERALSHVIMKFMDEHIYWCGAYARWTTDKGWAIACPVLFGDLPKPLQLIVPSIIRRKIKKKILAQGLGLHDETTVTKIMDDGLSALSELLGDNTFFLGKPQPTTIDAVVYGFLLAFSTPDMQASYDAIWRRYANLPRYIKSIEAQVSANHASC